MRTLACVGLVLVTASGCLRLDIEGSEDPFVTATAVSDINSIATCPVSIAQRGDRFGVVWQEYAESWRQLMFAEVSASGSLISGPSTMFPLDPGVQRVRLFTNDSGYVAFYMAEDEMWAAFVDGPTGQPVNTGWFPGNAVVVQNNDGFAVFYESGYRIYIRDVDQTGAAIDEARLAMPVFKGEQAAAESPYVIFDPATGYHLAWNNFWGSEVGYAHLDTNGNHVFSTGYDFGTHSNAQVATDGAGGVVLTWYDGEFIDEYAIDATDHVPMWAGVRRNIVGNRDESMDYAVTGGEGWIGLAWESDADTVLPQINMTRYQIGGDSSPAITPITSAEFSFACPQVARGSEEFGVAFIGEVDGGQRLYLETHGD